MADNLQTCWVGLDATTNRRPVLFDAAAATQTDLLQLLSRQRSRPIGTHGPYATPHHSFFLNVRATESNDLLTVRIVPASGCILHRANPAQHPQGFDAGTAQLRVRSAQFQLRRSELALFSNPARRFGGELSFDVDSTPNERQQDYSPECYASVCRNGRGEIQLLIGHRAGNEPAVFPHSSLLELLTLPDQMLRPADAFDASEYSAVRRWSQEREVHGVVLMFTIEDFFAVGAKQRSFRRLTISPANGLKSFYECRPEGIADRGLIAVSAAEIEVGERRLYAAQRADTPTSAELYVRLLEFATLRYLRDPEA